MKPPEQKLFDELSKIKAPEISHSDKIIGILNDKIAQLIDLFCRANQDFKRLFQGLDREALISYFEDTDGQWISKQISSAKLPRQIEPAEFRRLLNQWQAELKRRIEDKLWQIERMNSSQIDDFMEVLAKYRPKYDVRGIFDGREEAIMDFYETMGETADSIKARRASDQIESY